MLVAARLSSWLLERLMRIQQIVGPEYRNSSSYTGAMP